MPLPLAPKGSSANIGPDMIARPVIQGMVFVAFVTTLLGCASSRKPLDAPSRLRERLDRQIEITFDNGVLFKPDFVHLDTLISTLAPLIIQETVVQEASQPSEPDGFGAVELAGIDRRRPVIYAHEGTTTLNGQIHTQVAFGWCYPAERSKAGRPRVRGVRMTLNSSGEPVIWEALADEGETSVLFVAGSLEQATLAQHGPPLPGRRFSSERSVRERPDVLVARVIDDGPIPMGPIVYTRAKAQTISTVLCRCMPAQVRNIVGNYPFELLPVDSLPDPEFLRDDEASRASNTLRALVAADGDGEGNSLESRLRLPDQF